MFVRTFALACALLILPGITHADEGSVLLEKLIALAKDEGVKITYGSLQEKNRSSFELNDVKIVDRFDKSTTIARVSVQDLQESGGRLTYDSIVLSEMNGETQQGGRVGIANVTTKMGDWPSEIWKDGLTAEERRQRIRFGEFSINGVAGSHSSGNFTLDNIVFDNADIPLDFRYQDTPTPEVVGEPAAPLTLGRFALSGLKGPTIIGQAETGEFNLESIEITDLSIPTSWDTYFLGIMRAFAKASIKGITVDSGNSPLFSLDLIEANVSQADNNQTISSAAMIEGLFVNLLAIPDQTTQQTIKALGYESVEASMTGAGQYNIETGRARTFDTVVRLKDMLDLSLDYVVTGYTPEIMEQLAKFQDQVASGKPPEIGQLRDLKLESLGIRIIDRSLTGRLLDYQASQMGTTGDQLAQGAPMMIGMGMAGLNMPQLTQMVTEAVGKFLQDKGSIEARAAPAEPVALVDLFIASQTDPTRIPEMLNLQVSAE